MTKQDQSAQIENVEFKDALSERYLAYALSTIMSRSLPDVRDGLKPVHRRLLYAMLQLNLSPGSGYKKCARIVGDVIGKYHPHGDVAVYETLVRLAQNFSLRYPLIDGQGNFGSIDGDNAAAMRYTESRLTEIGILLVQDIDKDTVDFRPTYDNTEIEPVLMPSLFPNLLANGSEGIAVGMATSIPPHNLHELCEALLHLIDHPNANCEDILRFIKGPDFPTGGVIVDDPNLIANSYTQGKGSFRVRARWHIEELAKNKQIIVITQIPYQVQKGKLIEQIANLLKEKKLPLITNIRDESAIDIRIVIEPRSGFDIATITESLFKLTSLESRVQLNMNVLGADNLPRVMNLVEVLNEFLNHRKVIVTRRSKFLIDKIEHRLEILKGLKIAYLNIDEVIAIIREEDEPKPIFISKFGLSDIQVEAILNLRLRSLRKLDEHQIIKEYQELEAKHVELNNILSNPSIMSKSIKSELKSIIDKFGNHREAGKRLTSFEFIPETNHKKIDFSAYIESEPLTVICSKMGWIRGIKGHNIERANIKYKDGDSERFIIEGYNTDKIIICTEEGKVFSIALNNISFKGTGESVRLMIDIGEHEIVNIFAYKAEDKFLIASSNGRGFLIQAEDLLAQTKSGKQIINITNTKCVSFIRANGDTVATTGANRKLLIFKLEEVPVMKRGSGVLLQKFKDGTLIDIIVFYFNEGLRWYKGDKLCIEKNLLPWLGKRGTTGKLPPVGFSKNNQPFSKS